MESYQYAPPPVPKKTNTVLIIVLVILGLLLLCCGGIVGLSFLFFNKTKGFIGCMSRYPFVYKATLDYAKAHHGKLPDGKNWQDEIAPYYITEGSNNKSSIIDLGNPKKDLGCPSSKNGPATGIAFNDELSGKLLQKVRDHGNPILYFEVAKTGRNLHEPFKTQPGSSPQTIVGTPRPWLWIDVNGTMPNMQNGQTINFNATVNKK